MHTSSPKVVTAICLQAFPAYGRTYQNSTQVWQDWNAGKDFKNHVGSYFSKDDTYAREFLAKAGYTSIMVHYGTNGKVRIPI